MIQILEPKMQLRSWDHITCRVSVRAQGLPLDREAAFGSSALFPVGFAKIPSKTQELSTPVLLFTSESQSAVDSTGEKLLFLSLKGENILQNCNNLYERFLLTGYHQLVTRRAAKLMILPKWAQLTAIHREKYASTKSYQNRNFSLLILRSPTKSTFVTVHKFWQFCLCYSVCT